MALFIWLWFALMSSNGGMSAYWIVVALVWHVVGALYRWKL